MQRCVLVNGAEPRLGQISESLEARGWQVIRAADTEELKNRSSTMPPGSLGCYIQLPRATPMTGSSQVERVGQFLSQGLLARFDAVSTVLPLMAPESCVVLAAGHYPDEQTPDDRHARIDLLRVLGRAILAEASDGDLRVIVVADDRTADDIALLAEHRGEDPRRRLGEATTLDPNLSYADWHREVLGLIDNED